MKKLILVAACSTLLSMNANAGCFGTSSYYNCSDSSGNNYSVSKFGDSTYMSGYNYNSGSTWSQTTNRIGDFSYTNGMSSDGGSWYTNTSPFGSYGMDSLGNFWSQ